MTATSTLIDALARTHNRIGEAFSILDRQRTPEARSATRILRRLRRNYPGAVRAEHVGRCHFMPVSFTLALRYVNAQHEVVGSEPWTGRAKEEPVTAHFREHAPAGAAYARLVDEEGRTILVAPPIRGYATPPVNR
jgi:hypothetical protein